MSTAIAHGVDYSWGRPYYSGLKAEHLTFVVRYVYPNSQKPGGKNLTLAEANALRSAGLDIVSNFEMNTGNAQGGYSQGLQDGRAALAQHLACGGPSGRPIYFSVDYDAEGLNSLGTVGAYFKGVATAIGLARTGVYGEYEVVKYLLDRKLVTYAWQTYAWSHGMYDERCQLAQDRNGVHVGGAEVDLDSAHATDFGQWSFRPNGPINPAPGTPPPHVPAPSSPSGTVYTVQRGDTLSGIAARYKTTVAALAAKNHISNPNKINVGQRIVIVGSGGQVHPAPPARQTYTVKGGDSLSSIADRYHLAGGWKALYVANKSKIGNDPNHITPGTVLVIPH